MDEYLKSVKPAAADDTGHKEHGDHLLYAAGASIFEQGMPGGDLYFIESGTVEIFIKRGEQDVILATMKENEIIGVMTCLTSEPRMASARAKTEVRCKFISHARIKKTVAEVPPWMKIVLKEFGIRLGQMNDIYSDAVTSMRWLEDHRLSFVYKGAQFAAAFAAVADLLAIPSEDEPFVRIGELMDRLEVILNTTRAELDKLYQVMEQVGLIKAGKESNQRTPTVKVDQARKVAYFAQFVRDLKRGPHKALLGVRFSTKETRTLAALVKLAKRLDMDMEKPCTLPLSEVQKSLERVTGVRFDRDALDKAIQLGLLSLDGNGNGNGGVGGDAGGDDEDIAASECLVFQPAAMGRIVTCLEAFRRFTAMDQAEVAAHDDHAA